ncbi:MAG: hypothetical protein HY903_24700 [Deltaproteobacteria bacterium]|nr:hypothetical protein [Deltaproteobacteria bacterium]
MSLSAPQLFAVWRVARDAKDLANIKTLQVDGQAVTDIPAALAEAERLLAAEHAALQHAPEPKADAPQPEPPPKTGMFAKLGKATGRAVTAMVHGIDRLERRTTSEAGAMSWIVRHTVRPLAAAGADVVTVSTVEVRLKDGSGYKVPVSVTDPQASVDVRRTDTKWSAAQTIPIPVPIVGSIYTSGAALAAAGTVAHYASEARTDGDSAKADAYDEIRRKQLTMASVGWIPVLSSVTSAYAVATAATRIRELKGMATIEQVATLGAKVPL